MKKISFIIIISKFFLYSAIIKHISSIAMPHKNQYGDEKVARTKEKGKK